jgi:molybdopterin converting factor small subunit
MIVFVAFGGQLKSAAGTSHEEIEITEHSTITQAIEAAAQRKGAQFSELIFRGRTLRSHILTCVNDEQVSPEHALTDGDRLLLLSAISGG